MNIPQVHERYNRALDDLTDHRLKAHGFNDPAEYVPNGCEQCFRLERIVLVLEKMYTEKLADEKV